MRPVAHQSAALLQQQQLVAALRAPDGRPKPYRLIETHISWVILMGQHAYKIKKAVNLGFLDFTRLDARQFYCSEELRLNGRLASMLYLDVVTIGGTIAQPVIGAQPAIEYAVRMRRFPQSSMMNNMLARNLVTPKHIDQLATRIADFHMGLPPATGHIARSAASHLQHAAQHNFVPLAQFLKTDADLSLLETIHRLSAGEFSRCEPLLRQRALSGCVRECHGDLHLGNIVIRNGQPVPFDGIEFSPELRWIDVISEISFAVMDFLHHNQPQLAWRLLNGYLERSGDYAGCGILRFCLSYRAMVRAKIAAIRGSQTGSAQAEHFRRQCRNYLQLTYDCLVHKRGAIIITHGLPGCGKSIFAQMALERLGAIRIRADIERKRLFGLAALDKSTGKDIYSQHATQRTYARLRELTEVIVTSGYPAIIDAAFLLYEERSQFRTLAARLDVPWVIAVIQTDTTLLAERLQARAQGGRDASEADLTVMLKLRGIQQALRDEERSAAITFSNNGNLDTLRAQPAWQTLEQRCSG
jgi:aminoglycoside phosphotransferase family enzyme